MTTPTHCRHGHALTPDNLFTRLVPGGYLNPAVPQTVQEKLDAYEKATALTEVNAPAMTEAQEKAAYAAEFSAQYGLFAALMNLDATTLPQPLADRLYAMVALNLLVDEDDADTDSPVWLRLFDALNDVELEVIRCLCEWAYEKPDEEKADESSNLKLIH